jgi:hypothetical protein
MNKILCTGIGVFGLISVATAPAAQAASLDDYYDLVRTNGQPRSEAVFQTAPNDCYNQTGASRYQPDTPAFKACMLGKSFRWQYVTTVPTPPPASAPRVAANASRTYIDPHTGMVCSDFGGVAVCSPPQGTVHYTRHGQNCVRTGLVAVCS